MTGFFERKEEARQNTKKLIGLYVLAVVGLTISVYLAVLVIVLGTDPLIRPGWLLVVFGGILYGIWSTRKNKLEELREGGRAVAEGLQGRRLKGDPGSVGEQQLLNVVEEVAIASGTPVPAVYVLDEEGINAFAAGHSQDDAVIGVTRGAIEAFERDELQGVVAHEFSHILNRDTALNLRLMGWTHGIQFVSNLGKKLVMMPEKKKGGCFLLLFIKPFIFLTFALHGIGGAGYICARAIKATVSREREFLADASAVEFTRNPGGIGGALLKLRAHREQGAVEADEAEAASHLFFADAVEGQAPSRGIFATYLFATHPDLQERIRRIDPALLEEDLDTDRETQGDTEEDEGSDEDAPSGMTGLDPDGLIDRAGTLAPELLVQARALHDTMPSGLMEAAHEPLGAVAIAYALVLDSDAEKRASQLPILREEASEPVVEETERLFEITERLDRSLRLPLVEVAAPALRELSDRRGEQVWATLGDLIEADERLTIFEFAVSTVVRHALERESVSGEGAEIESLDAVQKELVVLLSGLARAGHPETSEAEEAFSAGYQPLVDEHNLSPADLQAPRPAALEEALERLGRATLPLREEVLKACARSALADETVVRAEEEVLRAVAMAFGVPLPSVLPGKERECPSSPLSR